MNTANFLRRTAVPKLPVLVLATCLLATVGCRESVRPLGGIALAPELPAGFTAEVVDMQDALKGAGVDVAGTLVFVTSQDKKNQGRYASVMIQQEDRVLPNKDDKITAYKAFLNGSHQSWSNRDYRVEKRETTDIQTIDPDKLIRDRITYVKDGHRVEVEHLVTFTDRGLHVCVAADHDDDFQLLSQWARSVRPK